MNRVTADEVKQIMDSCTLEDSDIDAYISTANNVITQIFANDTVTGSIILADIEKWYTAHLIACSRQRITTRETVGDVTIQYAGTFGAGLTSTPYGQMVQQLDVTGKMSKMGKAAASIRAIKSFD